MPITAPSDRLFITVSCAVRDHSINGSSLTAHDLIAKCIFCVMSFARPCRPRKFKHTIHKLPITVSPMSSLPPLFLLCTGASACFLPSSFSIPEHKRRALRHNS